MTDTPEKTASADEVARPASPGTASEQRKLFPMSLDEVATHLSIALSVIKPAIQFGRGRKLPHQSDNERREAAKLIVEHSERSGIKWYRRQQAPWHGGGSAKEKS